MNYAHLIMGNKRWVQFGAQVSKLNAPLRTKLHQQIRHNKNVNWSGWSMPRRVDRAWKSSCHWSPVRHSSLGPECIAMNNNPQRKDQKLTKVCFPLSPCVRAPIVPFVAWWAPHFSICISMDNPVVLVNPLRVRGSRSGSACGCHAPTLRIQLDPLQIFQIWI